MRAVWKFQMPFGESRAALEMPVGAKVVLFDHQEGVFCIWAEVDTDAPLEQRGFAVVGTGHPIPDAAREHVHSFQAQMGGLYVWHLYELVS